MKYIVSAILDEMEMMEIASMVWGVVNWEKDKQDEPIARAFLKIRATIDGLVDPDQRMYLDRVTKAVQAAFADPSIERGMVQGGFVGIMDRIETNMEQSEPNE